MLKRMIILSIYSTLRQSIVIFDKNYTPQWVDLPYIWDLLQNTLYDTDDIKKNVLL